MSKKITKAQELEMKQEHEQSKAKFKKATARLFYFLLAVGNIAIISFLTIMNASPELGHYILSGFAGASALCFIYKLIEE
jgi:hypothetical protein